MSIFKTSPSELIKELRNNEKEIISILNRNRYLYNQLSQIALAGVTSEQKERYDKELASDNWKNYSAEARNQAKIQRIEMTT